jgi:hypothetical protein
VVSKRFTFTIHNELIPELAKVKNRSALINRLLCAYFNLDPDTLEPIDDEPKQEDDTHGI